MIPLETEFYSKGFVHKLIRRIKFTAIYARFRRSDPENVHYEVVRIKTRPALTVFGKDIPAHEFYPPSESWGSDGFTYRDEDQARAKFEALARTSSRMRARSRTGTDDINRIINLAASLQSGAHS